MSLYYIFSTILSFIFLFWLIKSFHFIDKEYPNGTNKLVPIGVRPWSFLLIILISLIPIGNLILTAISFIGLFLYVSGDDDLEMKDILPPEKQGRFLKFLNKDFG